MAVIRFLINRGPAAVGFLIRADPGNRESPFFKVETNNESGEHGTIPGILGVMEAGFSTAGFHCPFRKTCNPFDLSAANSSESTCVINCKPPGASNVAIFLSFQKKMDSIVRKKTPSFTGMIFQISANCRASPGSYFLSE